ncbi:MAG: alpha-ketoglutarate-dependent dioxygenase AlkB family protein [Bacteroidia bacterium]
MDLFNDNGRTSILAHDGTVNYYGAIMSLREADRHYNALYDTLEWRHDEAHILGKHFITPRKVAWYGDKDFSYTYSGITKTALCWTPGLLELKRLVEGLTGSTYNSCLANLYHNGSEGMAWHSDDEKMLGTTIASLSFGAERKFSFKHKRTKETASLILAHGSLLVMKDETQLNWMHRLPPTTKIKRPRINLTFRTIIA